MPASTFAQLEDHHLPLSMRVYHHTATSTYEHHEQTPGVQTPLPTMKYAALDRLNTVFQPVIELRSRRDFQWFIRFPY